MASETPAVCVLVVDDHVDTVRLMRLALAYRGYGVVTATTAAAAAAAAAALARAGRCDLMVIDIGMPDRSGLALMREVKACPGIPVVALSSYAHPSDEADAMAAGFDRYMTKPIDFSALIDAVRELTPNSAHPVDPSGAAAAASARPTRPCACGPRCL
jgi:two-component system KDP operon response regulator KdpE